MSEQLKQFFRDYLQWAEEGAKDNNKFNFYSSAGLCTCLFLWLGGKCYLDDELKELFRSNGLCAVYPFNNSSPYFHENNKTRNRQRMDFVRKYSL